MKSKTLSVAAIYGLIAGLLMILLTVILYLRGVEAYMGKTGYLGYVVLIALAIMAAVKEKKANNGFLEFRDALKTTFLVFVVALALYVIFSHILLNYIDPGFRQQVEKAALQRAEKLLQDFGYSQEKIDEMREKSQQNNTSPSIFQTLLGLAIWYIVFFIFALIIAAIIKKKKPEFSDSAFK